MQHDEHSFCSKNGIISLDKVTASSGHSWSSASFLIFRQSGQAFIVFIPDRIDVLVDKGLRNPIASLQKISDPAIDGTLR